MGANAGGDHHRVVCDVLCCNRVRVMCRRDRDHPAWSRRTTPHGASASWCLYCRWDHRSVHWFSSGERMVAVVPPMCIMHGPARAYVGAVVVFSPFTALRGSHPMCSGNRRNHDLHFFVSCEVTRQRFFERISIISQVWRSPLEHRCVCQRPQHR